MNITGVTKHFPTPSEVYTNNLSASISAGAVTVPVNANNDYADGDIVVLTVEPGTTNEATFTGEKASTPARFINCVWTEGNLGVGHASGVTIIDYIAATHLGIVTKGLKVAHNQDGTLKTSAVQAALNISSAVPSDYTALAQTATTVTPNGNRSYSLTFPSVNYTDRLSPGMRLRAVRSTATPNQSASFDGVNDYFSDVSVNGMTFTDDFVASGWIKLRAYGAAGAIITRYNGTSGFRLNVEANGQITLAGFNAGAGNFSFVQSTQIIPLNEWVHVVAQLDMSSFTVSPTTSYVMLNGKDVPAVVARSGTNPTALIQAGDLQVGAQAGSMFFPGSIAQPAIFNAKITQATARGYMSQGLLGTETALISAYSLNNTLNDLNVTNANNLTANGGVVATSADSPFGQQGDGTISTTVDYGIIQKSTYSAPDTTVVLQAPEGGTIPTSGGVASISYSQFKTPYQFPTQKGKWKVSANFGTHIIGNYVGVNQWAATTPKLEVPIGDWRYGYQGGLGINTSVSGTISGFYTLAATAPTNGIYFLPLLARLYMLGSTASVIDTHTDDTVTLPTETTYTLYSAFDAGSGSVQWAVRGDQGILEIFAENGYL